MGVSSDGGQLGIAGVGKTMVQLNLNQPGIMDAQEASKIWGHSESYVRMFVRQNPDKFPEGSIRKFGNQWVVTTEGMEAITGVKDPRKRDGNAPS